MSNVKAEADRSFRNAMRDADSQRAHGTSLPQVQRAAVQLAMTPRVLILGVCGWSLIEIPAEFDPAAGEMGIAALTLAKLAWTVIGIAAVRGMRRAQWIFSFLCGLSLVAIVPALPVELSESASIFTQSLIECVLKAGALLALCLPRVARPAAMQTVAWDDDDSEIQKP
ncbi:hypothetical protein [Paraburkholderia bengalensis]|uniref:hypothetical protein n=1 Tax=Paraburkholderia bengalensis TaxID=2747562 RepID=UPI003014EFCA